MHPKELSPRTILLKKLNSQEVITPQEQQRAVLDKYSKVNDGKSYKTKFYEILQENVHRDGSFMAGRRRHLATAAEKNRKAHN